MARGIFHVVGEQWVEGKLEKTVQCTAAGIDGSDTCRSQNHIFLLRLTTDIPEKSRFAGASLAGEKQRTIAVLH